MKRVLQVVGKMNIGGAEQLLMNVYRNIDRTKVQFDFLTFYAQGESGYFDEEIQSLGGNIINVKPPKPFDLFGNVKAVRQVLRENRYDAVHTHIGNNAAFAHIAAKKEGIPIRVAHSQNTPNTSRSSIYKVYDKILSRFVNKSITKCAACSKEAAEYRFSRENIKNNYLYVPNSVDFSKYLIDYKNEEEKLEIGVNESDKVILQVGNFKEQKNQLFTIELIKKYFKNNETVKFVFAGRDNDAYGESVKQKINEYELNSNALLLGQRADIPELMSMADVLIMPSNWEGLGIVLIEAQASGLPCVVSEAIQKEADLGVGLMQTCLLSDMESWQEGIYKSLELKRPSAEQRKAYIQNSDFNLEKTVACFEKLYEI